MMHLCPHCGNEFSEIISDDYLGWHTSCPCCGRTFDVNVYEAAEVLKSALIGFILNRKTDMEASDITEMENNPHWCQAKDMFVTLAILLNCDPDTGKGDNLWSEIYYGAKLEGVVSETDLDFFFWTDLT